MAAGLYPAFQFFDNDGEPLNGGLVYTYAPGTTTPKASYQDAALSVPHANPIVLSAFGRPPAPIWLDGETKVVVKTALGDTLDTVDNVNADVGGLGGWATKGDGVLLRSASYDITPADDGKTIVATAGSWTLGTAEPAATMSDGFVVDFYNAGPGVITFDPNGSETVDGEPLVTFGQGDGGRLVCDGTNWRVLRTRNVERASFKNLIINGDFSIDQRNGGTSLAATASNAYCMDRWVISGAAGIAGCTVQRVQAPTPGSAQFVARLLRSSGTYASVLQIAQVIEHQNCYHLAGRAVTLSFKARKSSGYSGASSQMTARIRSGTVADEGVDGLTAGTWTGYVQEAQQNFTLTTNWQTFNLSCTIQAGAKEVGVMLLTTNFSGTGSASDYIDIADAQLELGGVATEFERLPMPIRYNLCQRYYNKGAISSTGARAATTNGNWNIRDIEYPCTMRSAVNPVLSGLSYSNCSSAGLGSVTNNGFSVNVSVSGAPVSFSLNGLYEVSAEL